MSKTSEARRKEDERFAKIVEAARAKARQMHEQAEKIRLHSLAESEADKDRKTAEFYTNYNEKMNTRYEERLANEAEIAVADNEGMIQQPIYIEQNKLKGEQNETQKPETKDRFIVAANLPVPRTSEQPEIVRTPNYSTTYLSQRDQKKTIVLNAKQQEAAELILSGKSMCLIGAAGTGKTTLMQQVVPLMQQKGLIGPIKQATKWLERGKPGVCVLAFTNKATANIAKKMARDITCITAHKLIEFEPVFYQVLNADGDMVNTMRFEPARNRLNPLPTSLNAIIAEEAGSISTILHGQITDAIRHGVQFIFLGDIQQLPPVYGQAILGFKMLELPTIELTEVHRQALDSPILSFAWELLDGKPMKADYIKKKYDKEGEFLFRPWKKKLSDEDGLDIACRLMKSLLDANEFDVEQDMILIPYNKAFGTIELNKNIAHHLSKKRGAEVHEIIAGWQKFYMAVGDKVLVQKQEAFITKIVRNGLYGGVEPLMPSKNLNRWGHYDFDNKEEAHEMSLEDFETMLAAITVTSGEIEDRKNQASHSITCKLIGSEEEIEVTTTGGMMEMSFGYALTVHKSQGSEWRKVLIFLHQSHIKMISRELLYTAVTRAKESLYIVAEPNTFEYGVTRQRIKGNTLAEKAEYFKGKMKALLEEQDE